MYICTGIYYFRESQNTLTTQSYIRRIYIHIYWDVSRVDCVVDRRHHRLTFILLNGEWWARFANISAPARVNLLRQTQSRDYLHMCVCVSCVTVWVLVYEWVCVRRVCLNQFVCANYTCVFVYFLWMSMHVFLLICVCDFELWVGSAHTHTHTIERSTYLRTHISRANNKKRSTVNTLPIVQSVFEAICVVKGAPSLKTTKIIIKWNCHS